MGNEIVMSLNLNLDKMPVGLKAPNKRLCRVPDYA
jgi:hypothetical protein